MGTGDEELRGLAQRAASGDPDAAEQLIRNAHRYLMMHLYVSGVPEADIDDVGQDVALQMYRSLHRYSRWLWGYHWHR